MNKSETRFTVIVCSIILLPIIAMIATFGIMSATTDDVIEYECYEYFMDTTELVYLSEPDTIVLEELELNEENFYIACEILNIKHPTVVYAQALHESGHFTSNWFNQYNNFLGLWNSYKHEPYRFDHWTGCLRGYRDYIQYRYDGDSDDSTDMYLKFIDDLGYAEDPLYDTKIRSMLKYIGEQV